MFRSSRRARLVLTAALVRTLSGAVPAFAGARQVHPGAAPSVMVVMTGLDNPHGLAFGKGDALYVAEDGRGGSGPCTVLPG
jgi:hypothetical protein